MDLVADVERIVGKLARVRERGVDTFGASAHGFELAPTVTEAQIDTVEGKFGIELPAELRAFLLHAGGSGAGPYYGIVPPSRWSDVVMGEARPPDFFSRESPWTPELAADKAASRKLVDELEEPFVGSITLCDQGCGHFVVLIVSGPARGRVMYVSIERHLPYFPENDGFLSWYERWLDELLWGHQHSWFGFGMPGDEEALARAAGDGAPRRLEALQAMHRLPAASPDTAAIIGARMRDAETDVRAAALALVAKFGLAKSMADDVRSALADPDAKIRLAALEAWIASGAPWHEDARTATRDSDENIATRAVNALAKAESLDVDTLVELLRSPTDRVRKAALEATGKLASSRLVDELLPLVRAEPPDQSSALLALASQIKRGAASGELRTAACDVVLHRFARTPTEHRTRALFGLAPFVADEPHALAAVIEATRDPDAPLRYEAAKVLGDNAGPEALPALRELSTDETMPRTKNWSTAWSVGENAKRAIAKIEARAKA